MRIGRLLASTAAVLCLGGAAAQPGSAGETVIYTYDALGRLIAAVSTGSVNNNQARSICYDPAGNRLLYKSSGSGTVASCPSTGSPGPTPTPTPPPQVCYDPSGTPITCRIE